MTILESVNYISSKKIGGIIVLKECMWNIFKKTGNIGSYIVYREIAKKEEPLFNNSSSASIGKTIE